MPLQTTAEVFGLPIEPPGREEPSRKVLLICAILAACVPFQGVFDVHSIRLIENTVLRVSGAASPSFKASSKGVKGEAKRTLPL